MVTVSNSEETTEFLLSYVAYIKEKSYDGFSVIQYVPKNNSKEIAEFLLSYSAENNETR